MTDHGLFTPDDDPEPNPRARLWTFLGFALLVVLGFIVRQLFLEGKFP